MMNLRLISCALLFSFAFFCRAQLVLNPGEVWTHSFATLPYLSTSPRPPGLPNYGSLELTFGSFTSGSTLQYEMFEGAATGSPVRSGLITSGAYFVTAPANIWGDLNGAVRLSMLTGGCTVASVALGAARPSAANPVNQMDRYGEILTPTASAPELAIRSVASQIEISWQTNGASSYVLESTNVLNSGAWPAVPGTPTVVGDRYVVTVSPSQQGYFRLRK
jgi:hypothetical protein